ncbi:MAG: hypothetical protein GY754_07870 [bacterium]|nr:hypothetical protein [bacterium]
MNKKQNKQTTIFFVIFPVFIIGIFALSFLFLKPKTFEADMILESDHFIAYSSTSAAQTKKALAVAEMVYTAYTGFIKDCVSKPLSARAQKHKLIFYRDKKQFKEYNRASGWAEGYYLYPYCHQYLEPGAKNPYHWMNHEIIHQLNREYAFLELPKWLDEGLGEYIGTSKIGEKEILLGDLDYNTYPLWWLPSLELSGSLEPDMKNRKIMPLRSIITNYRILDINEHFNLYYIHWWSLVHFCMHYKKGKYRAGFKNHIKAGGSISDFKKHIDPVEIIEPLWYEYLRRISSETK